MKTDLQEDLSVPSRQKHVTDDASAAVLISEEKSDGTSISQPTSLPDESKAPSDDVHEFPEGGTRAWLVAAGAASILFSSMGWTNSFGIFEAYYQSHQLQAKSADDIAWIGSLQNFLQFAAGGLAGPLFDRYGPRIIRPAVLLYIVAIMLTSLCFEYWHFLLAQGVLTGSCSAFLVYPAMAAVSQYFQRRRGAALGLALAGSSAGSVVIPIVLGKLLNGTSLGFGWSTRIAGFIMIVPLLFASMATTSRLPPRRTRFYIWSAFQSARFNLLVASLFFAFLSIFTPFFYLTSYAITKGMDATLASYLVAMLNGASMFGRIIPGILSDKYGQFNIFIAACLSSGLIILCWTQATTTAAIIVYVICFGFCSGAIISGGTAVFTVCTPDPREIGTYMGMGLTISSIAVLIGAPASGALLDRYGILDQAAIFSGVVCLAGGLFAAAAKFTTPKGIWDIA